MHAEGFFCVLLSGERFWYNFEKRFNNPLFSKKHSTEEMVAVNTHTVPNSHSNRRKLLSPGLKKPKSSACHSSFFG
jgi:hypothetical protein